MLKNSALTLLVLAWPASQLIAQSEGGNKTIDWLSLTHSSCLSKKDFRADERVTIQDKIPLPELVEGTVYLYCKESGALLDAVPIKDAYWVMIFPHTEAKRYNFKVVDSDILLEEGIDVKLLRQVLRMNKGHGMSGPITPFVLDIRFTAKWNRDRHASNTSKP